MQMTKEQMVKELSERCQVTQDRARHILDVQANIAQRELANNGKFSLHGVGSFSVVATPARVGHNPRTKEAIEIPAGKRIKVTFAKSLKQNVCKQ